MSKVCQFPWCKYAAVVVVLSDESVGYLVFPGEDEQNASVVSQARMIPFT